MKENSLIDVLSDKSAKEGKNTVLGTSLAIIATTMGGGIVSIPYAYASSGFVNGLII